jgi:hypothetical protein
MGEGFMPRNDADAQKPEDRLIDEPGMEERFQRALRKALNTPPKPHKPIGRKAKERSTSKGRVQKGKTRS